MFCPVGKQEDEQRQKENICDYIDGKQERKYICSDNQVKNLIAKKHKSQADIRGKANFVVR